MKRLTGLILALMLVAVLALSCAPPAPAPSPAPAPAPTPAKPTASPSPTAPAPAPAPAPAAKVIELRFSHHNPPQGRTTVKMLDPLGKKIEEASKGRVKVTMYPSESLAKSKDQIEAVTSGMADIGWLNLGNWTGRFPLTEVMNLPFIIMQEGKKDGKSLSTGVINSILVQEIYDKSPEIQAEWAQMKVLLLHSSDAYFIATTKKPVKTMADIKGMKLRTFGKNPTDMYKLLGAATVNLAMPDVYDAAQKGVIDGMGAPWAAVATYKLYEVFKYWTDVGTDVALFAIAINKDKWNSLPPDVQTAIMGIGGLGGAEWAGNAANGAEVKDETIAVMTKAGKPMERIVLDAGEFEKMVDIAGKPLWNKWVADTKGPAQRILDDLMKTQEKYK